CNRFCRNTRAPELGEVIEHVEGTRKLCGSGVQKHDNTVGERERSRPDLQLSLLGERANPVNLLAVPATKPALPPDGVTSVRKLRGRVRPHPFERREADGLNPVNQISTAALVRGGRG